MRLGDLDALCDEFKRRQRAALRWKEEAILADNEESKIRADAVLSFLCEVKLTIDNALTVEERPTGEWIPVTKRPMTDDEWEDLPDEAKDYIDEDGKWFFDCPMPEDGQNIIISTKWGVWGDTCEISAEGGLNAYYLEGQGDWDGVLAWMPMPEPYKEGIEELDRITCYKDWEE